MDLSAIFMGVKPLEVGSSDVPTWLRQLADFTAQLETGMSTLDRPNPRTNSGLLGEVNVWNERKFHNGHTNERSRADW